MSEAYMLKATTTEDQSAVTARIPQYFVFQYMGSLCHSVRLYSVPYVHQRAPLLFARGWVEFFNEADYFFSKCFCIIDYSFQ